MWDKEMEKLAYEFAKQPKIREQLRQLTWNEIFIELETFFDFNEKFAGFLLENPREALELLSIALSDQFYIENPEMAERWERYMRTRKMLEVRIIRFLDSTRIHRIDASLIGKLIQIEGRISALSPIYIYVKRGAFQCMKCGNITYVDQSLTTKIKKPFACADPECRAKRFFRFREDESTFGSYRIARVDETIETSSGYYMTEGIDVILPDSLAKFHNIDCQVRIVGIPSVMRLKKIVIIANSIELSDVKL